MHILVITHFKKKKILFQFSNFAFIHSSFLSYRFIQLRSFSQILLKSFEKKKENIFQLCSTFIKSYFSIFQIFLKKSLKILKIKYYI